MLMQMIKRDNSVMINDIVKHIVRNKEQHAYSIANNLFNKNTPYYTLPPVWEWCPIIQYSGNT